MRRMMLAAAFVLAAVPAFAQALPFVKHTVSQEEYAKAIEKNDRKVLNVSCEEMMTAANAVFEANLSQCADLGAYVRQLEVKPCPTVTTTVARVLPGSHVDLYGYSRELREGETCLYENNSARWFASLSCGNFITKSLPVYTAMKEERKPEEKVIVEVDTKPALTPGPIAQAVRQAAVTITPEQAKPDDVTPYLKPHHSVFSLHRTSGKIIWGSVAAGAVVCGFECREKVVQVTNVNVVVR